MEISNTLRRFAALALLAVPLSLPAMAQAQTANVSVGSGTITLPGAVSIPISITDLSAGSNVGAITVELNYDPAVVSTSNGQCSVNPGGEPNLTFVFCNQVQPGTVRLTGTALTGVGNDFVLANLQFTGVANGTSVMDLTVEALADSGGVNLTANVIDGSVVVGGTTNLLPVAAADSATTAEDVAVLIDLVSNDFPGDAPATIAPAVSSVEGGGIADNGDGTVTYTPPLNYNGPDAFQYTLTDANGDTDIGSVSISVSPVNDSPIAVADSATTNEDVQVLVPVTENDQDIDGDALQIVSIGQPANGSAVDSGNGIISYLPDANFNGNDGFSYTISDGNGGTSTASVSVTVLAVNDNPEALDDLASTDEELSVDISVLANDSDADGDSLTISAVGTPGNGSATPGGAGVITYLPEDNFAGTDTFSYSISDGAGGTDSATVTVIVGGTNDLPVAGDDAATTDEDTAATIIVLANDTDADGDELTVQIAVGPADGTAAVNGDGSIQYTPSQDFNGNDSFTYSVSDGNGGTDTASVFITVNPVNDAPQAADDSSSTSEDDPVAIDVLANDSDVDGDVLTVTIATPPDNGSVTVSGGIVTYSPAANFSGSDSFVYEIGDGNGGADSATVTIVVESLNDAPTAGDDSATGPEDTPILVAVLANDTDEDGDTLTVASTTMPANGVVDSISGGTITYLPDANFNGNDSFQYTVSDGNGGSATATVNVVITPVNDAPVANDDTGATVENNATDITVLANDSDVDGDSLTVSSVTPAASGAVTINGDQTLRYTPNAGFTGSDTFSYTISDGNGGTATANVSVNVSGGGPDAVITAGSASVVIPDQVTIPISISVPPGQEFGVADFLITYDPAIISFVSCAVDPGGATDLEACNNVTPGSILVNALSVNGAGGEVLLANISFQASSIGVSPVQVSVQLYTDADGQNLPFTTLNGSVSSDENTPPDAVDDSETTAEDTPVNVEVLANDSDADGDSISVTGVSVPVIGSVVVNGDNTITYTPEADFSGLVTFTYSIEDARGGTDSATVSITVSPVNDLPTANDDSDVTDEDNPVTITVLANDSDPEDDPLTVALGTPAANGTLTLNGDNTITYTPNANYNGPDSFGYSISDGNGGTDTATVSIAVNPINDDPVANADTDFTSEDTSVTVSVLANDTDVDGDTLSVTGASDPAHGTAMVNPDNTITYTPDADYNGTDSFTYDISDGNGGTATATVTIEVGAENDAPTANDDSANTDEDTPVTITVLANDSDPEDDPLSVSLGVAPSNGTVAVNGDNTITYTPNANYNGGDSFGYSIDDGNGGTDTATVTITVNPINDDPVANDDTDFTSEDTAVTVSVLANDSDVDGDTLSVTGASDPANGTAMVNPDNTITYTPDADYNGTNSFTYHISDGNGGTATATVTITVGAENDAPTANDDSDITDEDTPVTITVLANDSDPEDDPLTVALGTPAANGTLTLNGDNTITYTPNANYNGPDSFGYSIDDGNGGTETASVTITVNPINDDPLANDDTDFTSEDTAVTVSVLANDTDVDGDTLSVTGASDPANGTAMVNPDNTITYTPAADYNGTDSFTYDIGDGNGGTDSATVTIEVGAENDAPTANDDSDSTDEDTPVTITVLSNDSDPEDDPLTVALGTPGANGTLVLNGDNTITYTPNANYNGPDSFGYSISDGNGGTDTATVSITVNPINDDPVANDDTDFTSEDTAVTVSVLANDTDVDGDTLSVTGASDPANGTAMVNPDNTITYTPDADYNGTDSFTYDISDGNGGTATATVTIEVGAENDAPTANDDSANTDEDTPVTITVLANDSDPEDDPLSVSLGVAPSNGTVAVNGDNTITYTPNANYNGGDSFGYSIDDGNGGSDTATVTITVNPINDDPVANDDTDFTSEDTAVTVSVLANDTDVDGDTLSVTGASDPANGTAMVNPDNTITYTPDADYNGTDSFTYDISDGNGGTATATVTITVGAENDVPIASDDSDITDEDTPVTITVLANDSDPEDDPLTVALGTPAANGTLVLNGDNTITYTPNANYNGPDSFGYSISDGNGGTDTATVSITVNPINDDPVANDDGEITSEDTAVTVTVLANDTDVDGDTLSVTGASDPANGTAMVNPDNTITYTPDADYNGTDSFTYDISDGNGGTDTATVTITVGAENDAPTANDDSDNTDEDTPVTITVLANDSDPEDDPLTVALGTPAANGTLVLNGDNTITYTPNANYNGPDSFGYSISDGNGGTDTATVSITVNPINDDPVANDDGEMTSEDTAVTVTVLANDTDVDGDTLSVTGATDPANGTAMVNPDNTITYTPDADYNGTDSFTYDISDGNGGTATATVTITVGAENDAPTANDDTATTLEDQPVEVLVLGNDSDPDGDAITLLSVDPISAEGGAITNNGDGSVAYTPALDFFGTDSFSYLIEDAPGATALGNVTITVLQDTDSDGIPNDIDADDDNDSMPDVYEDQNGLDSLVDDFDDDDDLDNATNGQEFLTGTDPQSDASTPEGADGVLYPFFRDHFDNNQFDDRWVVDQAGLDRGGLLLEMGTELQLLIPQPFDECTTLSLDSFAGVDFADGVFRIQFAYDGFGEAVFGLQQSIDDRIEVVVDADLAAISLRSWSAGVLTSVTLPGDVQSGESVTLRLVRRGDAFTVYLNGVFIDTIVSNGLGTSDLRPYTSTVSCPDDGGSADTRVNIIELLLDRDGDGLADTYEDTFANGSVDVGETDALNPDTDGDEVTDGDDVCSLVPNFDQRDTNGDLIGNACDADLDNDGVVSFSDLAELKQVFFTPDADADFNGDGTVNFFDLAFLKQRFFQAPGPSGPLSDL